MIIKDQLENFLSYFDDFLQWGGRRQSDYFAFFVSNEMDKEIFTVKNVEICFQKLKIKIYPGLADYLSKESRKKNGKYIKEKVGYSLERNTSSYIKKQLGCEPSKITASKKLIEVTNLVTEKNELSFLKEAINCYQISSFRAAIIMVWILTINHLQRYIFNNHNNLADFNLALSKNPLSKKTTQISKYDDFSDIKEERMVELMRSSKIISNDVRKILEEKLGIRNTAAHPSTVTISEHKATEFIIDLVENIILKYQ
jgi:hypothetical protein